MGWSVAKRIVAVVDDAVEKAVVRSIVVVAAVVGLLGVDRTTGDTENASAPFRNPAHRSSCSKNKSSTDAPTMTRRRKKAGTDPAGR